jgi:Nitroreductase family
VPKTLTRDDVETVVRAATLAPSVLNIQPWHFVARGDAIEVHTDQDRALPFLDPLGRAITVSCGAAVFNLRLAMAALRKRPGVELIPEGTDGSLLAIVHAGEDAEPNATEVRLYHAIPKRRSSRVPFVDEPLPPETVVALEDAAAEERAMLRVLSSDEAFEIARLVHEADLAQRFDPRLRTEIVRWTDRGPGAVDGIPQTALGPAPRDASSLVRDFAFGLPIRGREEADFERQPTLAVLATEEDDKAAWLRAGQALERVWLEATDSGIAVSLLTQPLELSPLRWLARQPLGGDVEERRLWPQALFRLGSPLGTTPPTPRRPLSDVLTFAVERS